MPLLGLGSRVSFGSITTIRQLADSNSIRFVCVSNVGERMITEYWAKTDKDSGWRIAGKAYTAAERQYPNLIGDYDALPAIFSAPVVIHKYLTDSLREKLPASVTWLLDVDYWNWENAYRWLLSASESDIIAHAERVNSPNWDESQEPYYVKTF